MASIIPTLRAVDRLEDDMRKALKEQRETPIDSGPVTAEMALSQYEAAAAAIGMMGQVIKDQVAKQTASLDDLHGTMKIIEGAANQIRAKGDAVYAQIEEARAVSEEIRRLCEECVKKVGA